MFSSKSFMMSGLIFKSLIHFEFIFVYGVRECSDFILLHVAVQFSQHHVLKRLFFLQSSSWELSNVSSLKYAPNNLFFSYSDANHAYSKPSKLIE